MPVPLPFIVLSFHPDTVFLRYQVPSLNEWNITSDDILAQLVHQVLQLYRKHQVREAASTVTVCVCVCVCVWNH